MGTLSGGWRMILLRDGSKSHPRERELQRLNQEAVALHEIGRQISSTIDVDQVLGAVVKNVSWLLECQFAGVALLSANQSRLTWRASTGIRGDGPGDRETLEAHGTIADLLHSGSTSVVHNPSEIIPPGSREATFLGIDGLRSLLIVPLARKMRVFGLLVCGFRAHHEFSEDDIRLLANLAGHAALALENARLHASTLEDAKKLKALTSRLTVIQEEERGRISRELHDGIGQGLTAIRFNLELLCREAGITDGKPLERIRMLTSIIDETLNDIRHMAFELRPTVLDDFGLCEALRIYAHRFSKQTGISVDVHFPSRELGRGDPKVEATLFRVVQESLTNVAKHAHARNASVRLMSSPAGLTLDVTDDGLGFLSGSAQPDTATNEGFGILNMKERVSELNGSFAIDSPDGRGTRIHVTIPFNR
jgi:signal transduction histidine kinase